MPHANVFPRRCHTDPKDDDPKDFPNARANAKLIAASPKLLAALFAAGNACNVCAAHDPLNDEYWFDRQRIVDGAIAADT